MLEKGKPLKLKYGSLYCTSISNSSWKIKKKKRFTRPDDLASQLINK